MKAASGPKPDVRPSGNRGPWSGRAWCRAEKERDMRDEQGQDERHPLHWQTACIAVGVWIASGALVAMAWGVLR